MMKNDSLLLSFFVCPVPILTFQEYFHTKKNETLILRDSEP